MGYEYEIDKRNWGYILEDKAKKNSNKIYLYFKDQKITYNDLNRYANRMANGYLSIGIKKGDCVSIMMPNCPEFLYHLFGLAKIGAIDNPINNAYKGEILRHVITNSDSKALVVHEEFLDRVKFIQDELKTLEKVIVYGDVKRAGIKFPVISFEELLKNSENFSEKEKVKHSDPLQIIYTSGTTGPSKGVVLSHHAVYCYAIDIIRFMHFNSNDIVYNCLPLFHQNHRFTATYTLLLDGAYAMGERYSATTFWDEIRKYKATAFHFLGAMPNFIYAQPPSPDDKNHNVKVAFGGPISVELCKEFEKRFNLKVCLGYYGLTEASGVTFMSAEEANSLKSEGRWEEALSAGRENKDIYEVKLVDDDDNEVPIGEVGEIICRPARPFAMISEYVNNPKATVKAFRNLWFHTGDLAKKDEHGYFYFVDRKKDYIRRRGENVSSFEVEWVINSHPAVLESAAIGIKSEFGEDEIKILVVLKDGEILKPEDIIKWCEPRMAYFMIPRYIEFRKELPKTPVGRIEKYKLREEGITPNTWDREKAGYKIKR